MKKTKDHNQADTEQCPESAANVDWKALFREFVESSFHKSTLFLKIVLGEKIATSGWVIEHTTGWTKQKKAIMEEVDKEADELIKEEKEETLVKAKKLYLREMRSRILTKAHTLSHKEMASNLRAIKTELGEPSIITKQNIVEEPLDDEEAFNRLMGHYENDTAKTTARKNSAAPKRKQRANAKALAGQPA